MNRACNNDAIDVSNVSFLHILANIHSYCSTADKNVCVINTIDFSWYVY